MATVINNPDSTRSSSGIVTAILVILALLLFFIFGLPALRGTTAPAGTGATVNVPDSLNVDVNPTE